MAIGNEFRNSMDELVVTSARNLLDDADIGIHDNFFKIGGNSVIAVRLGRILGEELGLPRIMRIILKSPVLADLSDALSELVGNAPA